jgi:Tol biopolymer transport system component
MWECAWSPDGRSIASHEPQSTSIAILDIERQEWTSLEGCEGRMFTWSADSLHLYFCSKDQKVNRVRIGDQSVEEVADLSSVMKQTVIFSMNQSWYGIDPAGSLITLRPLGTTEIYAMDFEAP